MLQESGKTVTGHEYPGRRLVQRRQTRPPAAAVCTLSQRNQKQPKKKEKSWNGPNRSLCAPQISSHGGEREVYAVSEQWKETLWIVQVTRWNIPPTLSQILFLHIMIHSAKAKTITTEDISCQSQPPFFGQLFWNEMRMLPKFWRILPTILGISYYIAKEWTISMCSLFVILTLNSVKSVMLLL